VFCDKGLGHLWAATPTQHDLHRLVLGSSKVSLPTHLKGLVLEHDFARVPVTLLASQPEKLTLILPSFEA
jgi:hypothetical protein